MNTISCDAPPGDLPQDIGSGDPAWFAEAHADTQGVFRYWQAKCAGRLMPARADIDPAELVPYLPSMMLVDVTPGTSVTGGPVYIYRLVGTCEVQVRGYDPTGQSVETHAFGLAAIDALHNYDQVVQSRAPWFDGFEMLSIDRYIKDGESIFLPLSADGDKVDMIMVFSVQEKL